MTTHPHAHREPRIQRRRIPRWMAIRPGQPEPADSAWRDAKVIAVCMVLLAAIYIMSNDPAFRPDPAVARAHAAASRPAPSPVVWRMPGVSR